MLTNALLFRSVGLLYNHANSDDYGTLAMANLFTIKSTTLLVYTMLYLSTFRITRWVRLLLFTMTTW